MINIPVSIGELIDKLSILQVKKTKISDSEKLLEVSNQFELLYNHSAEFLNNMEIENLYHDLVKTNSTIWDIEDKLREYEKLQIFEGHFIRLSRDCYILKDKRSLIKNKINEISDSDFKDVKSYEEYETQKEELELENRYIFESPDNGLTIYRRKLGENHNKRELVQNG